jgi:hypothetical protein
MFRSNTQLTDMALDNEDIYAIKSDETILKKIEIAIADACNDIRQEDPGTAARRSWVRMAMGNPADMARILAPLMLVQNRNAANPDAVRNAADSAYKNAVLGAVDVLAPEPVS